jgi:hypothetical protein
MKRIITIIFTILTFCSCATYQLYPPDDLTQEEINRQTYDCRQVSTQYSANVGAKGNPFIISDEYTNCLRMKYGWTQLLSQRYASPSRVIPAKVAPVQLNTPPPIDNSTYIKFELNKVAVVKYDAITIYEKPGFSNAVGTRTIGDILTAVGEKKNWYLVELTSNQSGWIAKDWVDIQ